MSGNPKILITGGFGNLGSWLCEYYNQKGYDITILSNRVREIGDTNYTVVQADISNRTELTTKLSGSFDYCIHTASYNEHFHDDYAEKALLINSLGTRNLIEIIKHSGIKRFIYFSTFHVYGNCSSYINELNPPSPMNDYATTHLFAEYYLKQFCNTTEFPGVICRLTNSYGAPKAVDNGKWYLVLNDLVKSAYEKGVIEILSNGKASRDFVWMGDVCQVTEKLLSKNAGCEIFNISSGQNYKVKELANIVRKVYEKRYQNEIDISVNQNDLNEYQDVIVDNAKLLNHIEHKFSNKLEDEIVNIFSLLENRGG